MKQINKGVSLWWNIVTNKKNKKQKKRKQKQNNNCRSEGWRDGSVVKNSCCSCRGQELRSCHPHSGSQLPLTPAAGDPTPYYSLYEYCTHVVYMHTGKHTHKANYPNKPKVKN